MTGMNNPRPSGRIRPPNMLYPALGACYKYKKLLLNGRYFINESKLNWTINSFANSLQSQTALKATISNHKQQNGYLNKFCFQIILLDSQKSDHNFVFGPRRH